MVVDVPRVSLLPRNCPICAATDQSVPYAEANFDIDEHGAPRFASRKAPDGLHWRLLECRRCDLLYASPIPPESWFADAYHFATFDTQIEAGFAAATYGTLLPRVTSRLPSLRGALDIGTGDGAFLEELIRVGFSDVVGIEPSAAPIANARSATRKLIRQGPFRGSDFTPATFSLVTCFQALEHFYHPTEVCRSAYTLLRPGGSILCVGHNRAAAVTRLFGRKSPIFDIEHLQLFSPVSARAILTTAGFENIEVGTIHNRYPLHYWAKLIPLGRSLKRRTISLLDRLPIGRIPVTLPAGNFFVIAFRR